MKRSSLDESQEKVRNSKWANQPKPYLPNPFKSLISSSEAYYIYSKNLGPGNYAHLGVYKGASAWCQLWGLKDTQAKLHCIDMWEIMPGADAEDQHKDEFKAICDKQGFADKVVICKGSTGSWAKRLSNLKFKYVFIDASHDYENVYLDWTYWSPLVEIGGEVSFHDTDCEGVNKVIKDINKNEWTEVEGCYSIRTFKRK